MLILLYIKNSGTTHKLLLTNTKHYCMKKISTILLLLIGFILLTNLTSYGQGLTTAAMNGTVLDEKGVGLPGANVLAIHIPSGTQYGISTRPDGGFNFPAVRTGGPYKITVTFVGYDNFVINDVNLALGQDLDLSIQMKQKGIEISDIVVSGKRDAVFNSDRTGAANYVTGKDIQSIPTISRSVTDMVRLTPQASGNSFAGRNNLYNNFSLDGSVFNNSFGLAATLGGQTNAQPISLDAIDQINVSLAPYDVRQGGFTGAGINAVTKSGTNEYSATVYSYMRNQNFTGTKVAGTNVTNNNFSQQQSGFSVGGPIIKNKLFFFVNAEAVRRSDPASTYVAQAPGLTGSNVTTVSAGALDTLANFLKTKFNYDPGSYQNYNLQTYNNKFLIRLDYSITERNKLSVRFNYLRSSRDALPSTSNSAGNSRFPSLTCMVFSNNGYTINNDIYSLIGELNTVISNTASNNLTVGYSAFRDYRSSNSSVFPMTDILNAAGTTMVSFGYEQYTPNNKLNTDVYQISDNLTWYKGHHTITVGGSYNYYKFENGFTPQYYGYYKYKSLQDFYNDANGLGNVTVGNFQLQYSAMAGVAVPLAKVNASQLGVYIQDELKVTPQLKLTYGLRIDVPSYPVSLPSNNGLSAYSFNDPNGKPMNIDVSQLPAPKLMWSPRIGFNYDILGNKTLQMRGGIGIFTGNIPFVWVSNQASNDGILFGGINQNNTKAYPFSADITKYIPTNATSAPSYTVNFTSSDFKMPQVLRTNLAVDYKLPYDITSTVEGIFTKDINAIYHYDANYVVPNQTLPGADNRFVYPASGYKINSNINGAYVLANTNQGYSYFVTAQLQKNFDFGLNLTAAYTYGETKDISSAPGSVASSSFTGNYVQNTPIQPTLAYSNYDMRHKLVGSLGYRIDYLKHFTTSIAAIYIGMLGGGGSSNEAPSTGKFSYTYSGDLNRDGISGNDLIYIPRNQSEINLIPVGNNAVADPRSTTELWNELNAYINQDDYLKNHRGQVMERNGAFTPWNQQVDVRLTQDFYFDLKGVKQTIQFTFDIINFGNLLNSDWGVKKLVTRTSFLKFEDFNGPNGAPRFSFPYLDATAKTPLTSSFINDTSLASRWQMQFGIRYIF